MNYYQYYYQHHAANKNKLREESPGKSDRNRIKAVGYIPSDKQIEFHGKLVNFFKDHGLKTSLFERPRNKDDYRRAINAMFTVLKKNGLYDNYFEEMGE